VHMVAARLGFEKAMVGTRMATPCPDCMDRLRKHLDSNGDKVHQRHVWAKSSLK